MRILSLRSVLRTAALLALFAAPAPLPAGEESAQTRLAIEGMTCGGCVAAVKVQLGRTEGVTAYQVSLEDAAATVTYDPARTNPAAIAASVSKTGFEATVQESGDGSDRGANQTATTARDCAGGTCQRDCCQSAHGPGDAASVSEAAGLVSLADGITPLSADFDAAKGRPRFLAVLSPTCSACVHGAEAIAEAILPAGEVLDVFVVWAPMLEGDDGAAASASSAILRGPEVRQYWDPERRAGTAFRRDVFPDSVAQMRRSLPDGHYFEPYLADRDPDRPEWDIYLYFGPEAQWADGPPEPAHWVRQTALLGGHEKGLSLLWVDDYASPPREGALAEELRRLVPRAGEPASAVR